MREKKSLSLYSTGRIKPFIFKWLLFLNTEMDHPVSAAAKNEKKNVDAKNRAVFQAMY